VLAYIWHFGDGGVAYGRATSHRFAAGAPRTAKLLIADGAGCGAVQRVRELH
jgi:hypothetical protein